MSIPKWQKKFIFFTTFSLTKHLHVKKHNPSCHIWVIIPHQDEFNLKGCVKSIIGHEKRDMVISARYYVIG